MKKVFFVFALTVLLSGVLIAPASSDEVAKCPVCGMVVSEEVEGLEIEGTSGSLHFCSEGCMEKFCQDPTAFIEQSKLDEMGITIPEECQKKAECPNCLEKKASADEGEAIPAGTQEDDAGDCTGDCDDCPDK